MLISIVIPVFNNEVTLVETYKQICELVQSSDKAMEVEAVFIDDGSSDDSWRMICQLKEKNFPVPIKAVRLSKNFGQLAATLCGYEETSGEAIVTLSADLQDPIELIPKMIEQFKEGNEVVIAYREKREDSWLWKSSSAIAYLIASKSNKDFPKGGFDYTLVSRRAILEILKFRGRHRFLQSDQLYVGFKRALIPYTRRESQNKKSGYNLSKRFKVFTDLIIDSSYWIIQLMSRIGLVVAFGGIVLAIWLTSQKIFYDKFIEGWAFLAVVTLVNTGLIMIFLGIISEYQWRIYDEIRSKPLFVVQERLT
jgi:glycosyltransferase involved in cell wall biosynthesis